MSVRIGKKARKAALLLAVNLFFLVLCFMVLVPVLYAFSVSLHAGNSLLGSDFSFLPRHMTLANYRAVFVEEPILRWFSNSMLLAAAAVAVSLGTGIPAAYVFSRKRFPGRRVILRLLILLYAFPALLSMTALYKLLSPMVLIYVWNEYIFAVNFMTGEDTFTLAAGLYSLQATEMSGSWPVFAAASIVVSIPILLIFFLLQKNMTTGLTSGGVKG